ncbi:MAG: PilN domain-containing protein [Methylovulum miyakonense]|uniref:PilN domain-containing protein n=1 Tax=Methylovulum miyakonense TaxID=645578 RepID=UPI003BB52827
MLNLNSTIDMDFKRFLRWWRRELDFLIPEKIKQLVNDRQGFIIVSPEPAYLALAYGLDGQVQPLARLERNEAGIAQFKALQDSDEKFAKASVIIRLTGQDAIHRELTLPAAAKENLQQVVAYELDRYTPFKAGQAYFAAKLLEGGNEPGQIKVMLILTPRELLDGLCEDLNMMGISPLFADYQGFPNALDDGYGAYNLLPERFRQKSATTPRLIHSALLASTLLLLLATLVLPVTLQYQTVDALAEKVKAIEKDAKKIKALQQEVDAVINETQKLLDEKRARPAVVMMLNELSRLIKDDTSLAYLQYSDGHLQIQGESPAASTLIGVLETSDLFNNARFVSPVTQNTVSKLERFQITTDVTQAGGATDENP